MSFIENMLEGELDQIFEKHSGTPELAKRLDEFIESQKSLGKPVDARQYYNVIQKAIGKVLENRDPELVSVHSCLKLLDQLLTAKPSEDHSIKELIELGMPQMIVHLVSNLLKFTNIEESTRCTILNTLVDIISNTVDFSEEGKNSFKCFVPIGMDLVVDETKTSEIRIETIKFLNGVVESYGRHGGLSDPIEHLPFYQNFQSILTCAGDLELQLGMTEFIFRTLSPEERQTLGKKWFEHHPDVGDNFCSIREHEFELDSRKFLNSLNENQLENRSVYSLCNCQAVFLGTFKVNCPIDEGYDGFWTDFNMGSQSISFFARDDDDQPDNWETVVIKCEYVTEVKLLDENEDGLIALILNLDRGVHTLLSACPEMSENYVKLLYCANNSPLEAANILFTIPVIVVPNHSPDVVSCTPPKASVAINAVHISRSKGFAKTTPLLTNISKQQKKDHICCDRLQDSPSLSDGHSKTKRAKAECVVKQSKPLPKKGKAKIFDTECSTRDTKYESDMGISTRTRSQSKETGMKKIFESGYNTENCSIGDSKNEKKERKKTQSQRSLIKKGFRDTSDEKTDTNSWGSSDIKSGYDTEDWTIEDSEIEKKGRKKNLEHTINNGSKKSQSRRSLIKKVYRDTSDEKTDTNSCGHSEIKSSPPSKTRSSITKGKDGITMLYSAKRAYDLKKKRQYDRRRNRKLEKLRRSAVHLPSDKYVGLDSTNYFYKIDWEKEERELEAKTRSRSDSELFRGSNDEKKKLNEEFAADGWAGDEMQSVGDVGRSENEQGKDEENTNQINLEQDPDSCYTEPKKLPDYMVDEQNKDAKGVISGLSVNDHWSPDFPSGDLLHEIPGDLLNDEDAQDKVGSSAQREGITGDGEVEDNSEKVIKPPLNTSYFSDEDYEDKDESEASKKEKCDIVRRSRKLRELVEKSLDEEQDEKGEMSEDDLKVVENFRKVANKDAKEAISGRSVNDHSLTRSPDFPSDDLIHEIREDLLNDEDAQDKVGSSHREGITGEGEVGEVEDNSEKVIEPPLNTSFFNVDEDYDEDENEVSKKEKCHVVRRSRKLRELVEKTLDEEQDEKCEMSEDDLKVVENFRNVAEIIRKSTCRSRSRSQTPNPRSPKKKTRSTRTQSRSKAKTSLKTSRDARFALEQLDDDERQSGDGQAETAGSSRKESIKRRERFSNNPFEFEVRAPKNVRCDDSGYFERTLGSSSRRKRTLDSRDEPTSDRFSAHRTKRHCSNPSSNPGDDKRSDITISEDDLDENCQTPGHEEFVPIRPRTLFQSGNSSAEKKLDYVNQIANSSMKLITERSKRNWARGTSKRKKLMFEYTSRVRKYIEEHQEASARKIELHNNMMGQLMQLLKEIVSGREQQEKCMRNIVKTHEMFVEAMKCREDEETREQECLQSSLRREIFRYRDESIKEIQKQEMDKIKRRIQAMIGATL